MKLLLNSLIVGLVTFVWAGLVWLNDVQFSTIMSSLDMHKPFVFRALVPFLARSLSYLGVRIDWAVCLVVTFFSVCFYLALRKLYFYYYPQTDTGEIYILLSVFVGLLVFSYCRWMYDLATAFFFTLALYYIVRVENWKFLVVFALATLNRETTLLLILVYVVFVLYYKKYGANYSWLFVILSVYVYGVITYSLRVMFQYNQGVSVLVEPLQNLHKYVAHPLQTLVYVLVLGVVLWRVFRNWNSKPLSLRVAFVVIAPVLFILYLVCGMAFEIRTFWEVYPLIVLLI
jgi:hypothetical protein